MTQERGPGDLIDDRFRLIERLGSGAMGAVWRALDEVLQREVALKEVKPTDPGLVAEYAGMLRARVLREAQALARIDHPHVVTIHNIVNVPGELHPWLVMELVRGGTLGDKLVAGPMAPQEVAELGRGLLGALRAAHAAGICHRDVKPANVLLRPDGRPVLTDFGIADLADTSRLTVTGGLTGSPAYIAPERLHGSEGNPASDLWSLGMLMYVAVEGVHPLRRSTAAATLAAVMSGVVPTATRAGALGPALRAVLVADPARRATAEQLEPLLVRALEPGVPGSVVSPSSATVPSPVAAGHPSSAGTPYPVATSAGSPVQQSPTGHPAEVGAVPSAAATKLWPVALPEPERKRRRKPGVVVWVVIGMLVLALIGSVLVPWLRDQATLAAGQSSKGPEPTKSAEPAEPVKLQTAAGIVQVIKGFETAAGTTEFSDLSVFEDHAVARVPVKGRTNAVVVYVYRDGSANQWDAGTAPTDGTTVDVSKVDWDILPKLLSRANQSLNVDKPTVLHVVVEADSSYDVPVIMIYLAGTDGGGYLVADLDGKEIDVKPAQ